MFIIEILLIFISIVWIIFGISKYGIWAGQAPGGGLFPLLAGGIILICCTFDIVYKLIKKKPLFNPKDTSEDEYIMLGWAPRALRPLVVVAYGFLSLLLLKYLGFILCSFLTSSIWMIFISKQKVIKSLIVSVITTIVLYCVFVLWLNIPFPKGIF